MRNNFESNEELYITETIDADTLGNLIYGKTGSPQDKRFFPIEDGGVFNYFRPSYTKDNSTEKFYSLVKIDEKIIGLSELAKNPYKDKTFWVRFVSVDPEYQGKGYASQLVKEIFKFAKQHNYNLEGSQRNKEGELKLGHLFERYADEFSVRYEPDLGRER